MATEWKGTLDLSPNNGAFTFSSWEEAAKWAEAETKAWKPIWSGYDTSSRYSSALQGLRANAKMPETEWTVARWQPLKAALENAYQSLVHHESPRGSYVLEIAAGRADGTRVAAAALAVFCGVPFGADKLGEPAAQRGVWLAISYLEAKEAAALGPRLEATYQRFTEWFDQAKLQIAQVETASTDARTRSEKVNARLTSEAETVHSRLESWRQEFAGKTEAEHREAMDKRSTELNELFDRYRQQLEDITKTYDDKLALQASVNYWETRRQEHSRWAKVFGWASVVAILVAAVGVFLSVRGLIPASATIKDLPIARLVESAVIITFVVWAVRIVARLFLINLHLSTDASQRVVMIKTYLALLRESAGVKDSDRALILEPLFRHAATGIVKDDANPPLLMGLLQQKSG